MQKPKGVLAIYDNGGETADRYTVYYRKPQGWPEGFRGRYFPCVGMSAHPFHPQGVGMHDEGMPGEHNGRRIQFRALPPDCQRLVIQDTKAEGKAS